MPAMDSDRTTNGYAITIRDLIVYAVKDDRDLLYTVPIVFGIISEKIKMDKVKIPDAMATHSLPYRTIV
jgi:hypothetical protein